MEGVEGVAAPLQHAAAHILLVWWVSTLIASGEPRGRQACAGEREKCKGTTEGEGFQRDVRDAVVPRRVVWTMQVEAAAHRLAIAADGGPSLFQPLIYRLFRRLHQRAPPRRPRVPLRRALRAVGVLAPAAGEGHPPLIAPIITPRRRHIDVAN